MVSCVSCMQQHPGISLFLCACQACHFSFYHLSHAMISLQSETTVSCSWLAYSLLDHAFNRNCVGAALNAPLLRDFFSCWSTSTFCAPECIFIVRLREAAALLVSRSTFLIDTSGCASTTSSSDAIEHCRCQLWVCHVGCCLSRLKDGHRINYPDCIVRKSSQWLCIFF